MFCPETRNRDIFRYSSVPNGKMGVIREGVAQREAREGIKLSLNVFLDTIVCTHAFSHKRKAIVSILFSLCPGIYRIFMKLNPTTTGSGRAEI